MKLNKSGMATIGLIFITFLAAMQERILFTSLTQFIHTSAAGKWYNYVYTANPAFADFCCSPRRKYVEQSEKPSDRVYVRSVWH